MNLVSHLRFAPLLLMTACTSGRDETGNGGDSAADSSVDSCADSSVDSGDSSNDSEDSPDSHDSGPVTEGGHFFPDGSIWYADATDTPVDPSSEAVIASLQEHGWGFGRFQVDFGLEVLQADADTTKVAFEPTSDFYSPDCDLDAVPMPEGGAVEGETGYACVSDGDCHLLVADWEEARLYEMWRANVVGGTFHGGCLAVWEMDRVYPDDGRGDQCTSADAAGYPIAPLLFTADEVASGEIDHAIRFILPNDIIRDGVFFHPATHATNSEGGGSEAVPYGAHLRLRPDFDLDKLPNDAARVVAVALQRYGMFLADGGNVALTARSDRSTEHTWKELGFDSHALVAIEPYDFELLKLGDPIELNFECVRSP
jgi:hypothetical protein